MPSYRPSASLSDSQYRSNHALFITHRHNTTTLSVAGSLSRIADGEWLRLCECVRRSAPIIGPLGQWRALCEGGWLGGVPAALTLPAETQFSSTAGDANVEKDAVAKDVVPLKPIEEEPAPAAVAQKPLASPGLDAPPLNPPGYSTGPPSAATSMQDLPLTGQQQAQQQLQEQRDIQEQRPRLPSATGSPILTRNMLPPAPDASRASSDSNNRIDEGMGNSVNYNVNSTNSQPLSAPRPPFALADGVDPNTGSVRSLSAFPAPPTHYPSATRQRSGLGLHTDAMGVAQTHTLASNPSSGLNVPASSNAPGSGGRSPPGNVMPRRLTESPMSNLDDGRGEYAPSGGRRDQVGREVEAETQRTPEFAHERADMRDRELELQRELEEIQKLRGADPLRRPVPVKAHTSLPLDARGPGPAARHGGYSSVDLRSGQGYRGDRYAGDDDETREFGVMNSNNNAYRSANDDTPRAQGEYNNASTRAMPMERADTGMSTSSGTGSLVAAMRNRYSANVSIFIIFRPFTVTHNGCSLDHCLPHSESSPSSLSASMDWRVVTREITQETLRCLQLLVLERALHLSLGNSHYLC